MAQINVEGVSLSVSFNIGGKDHLLSKMGECMRDGRCFHLKTNFNSESYYIDPIRNASLHMPSQEVVKYHSGEEMKYQLGIAMMFCTEIVPLASGLPEGIKARLENGLQ